MYRDKKISITVIWFLNTFPIFRYTSVPHTLIYLWRLTSLNKYEHCTFQNQNTSRVFYMNVSLKGTDCFQKSFDGILILSDKEAFVGGAALINSRYWRNRWVYHSHSASCWQTISLHLSPAPATCFFFPAATQEHSSYSLY